jgi:hypothetical protein
VIVGDGNYDSEDFSDFINTSEYVVRTDYGKNIHTKKLGHKTDILYIDRFNFTPFDLDSMSSNYDNFLYKNSFDNCREIWLPIQNYLINEVFLSHIKKEGVSEQPIINGDLLERSWDNEESREVMFHYIRHLYMHNKTNIKMLDFNEYQELVTECFYFDNAEGFFVPSPLIYCAKMALSDSRFAEYPIFYINSNMSEVSINLGYDYQTNTTREKEYLKGTGRLNTL